MDPKNCKYYLVDLLPDQKNNCKARICFRGEKHEVDVQDIMQYDPDKGLKLEELKFINEAEVMDWLKKNGSEKGWVTLNSKVAIDFSR